MSFLFFVLAWLAGHDLDAKPQKSCEQKQTPKQNQKQEQAKDTLAPTSTEAKLNIYAPRASVSAQVPAPVARGGRRNTPERRKTRLMINGYLTPDVSSPLIQSREKLVASLNSLHPEDRPQVVDRYCYLFHFVTPTALNFQRFVIFFFL
jgi:hypothetical protein